MSIQLPIHRLLEGWDIVLASQSPRRKMLLEGLGLTFRQMSPPSDAEPYPEGLAIEEIPTYLSRQKALSCLPLVSKRSLVISADTIVALEGEILHKPQSRDEAIATLTKLQGRSHTVYTGLSIAESEHQQLVSSCHSTRVYLEVLPPEEIAYYVDNYRPYDKAGAYGIQEWIGARAVSRIEGSFYTVMGLPTHDIFELIRQLLEAPSP